MKLLKVINEFRPEHRAMYFGQREELKLSNAGYEKLNELAAQSKDPAVMDAIKKMMFDK